MFLLHRLRSVSACQSKDWLWIDALSINQSDAAERRHQIGIMSEIFGRARQVLVWLGSQDNGSDIAMRSLDWSRKTRWDKATAEAVLELCERPYWRRSWIFQELKHAKKIHLICGDESLAWDSFVALFNGRLGLYDITDPDHALRIMKSSAARIVRLLVKLKDTSLWFLLLGTKRLACTDKRDKVYAILSVATSGCEGIEADYTISCQELGYSILRNKHALQPFMTLHMVQNHCKTIGKILGTRPGSLYSLWLETRHKRQTLCASIRRRGSPGVVGDRVPSILMGEIALPSISDIGSALYCANHRSFTPTAITTINSTHPISGNALASDQSSTPQVFDPEHALSIVR
jgi:hypothetical protein